MLLGSATPEFSTTTKSYLFRFLFALTRSFRKETKSSSLKEQHTHPFCNSIVSTRSFVVPVTRFETNLESMLMLATSLTIHATRLVVFCRRFRSMVVFPTPKKPERRITGTLLFSFSRPSAIVLGCPLRLTSPHLQKRFFWGVLIFPGAFRVFCDRRSFL